MSPAGKVTDKNHVIRGIKYMGWKSKFIFLLLVYSSGFSTAVYFFGPEPKCDSFNKPNKQTDFNFEAFQQSSLFKGRDTKSEKFVQSFNAGLHKGINISKDTVLKVKELLKEHFEQRKTGQTGFK